MYSVDKIEKHFNGRFSIISTEYLHSNAPVYNKNNLFSNLVNIAIKDNYDGKIHKLNMVNPINRIIIDKIIEIIIDKRDDTIDNIINYYG